MIVPNTAPRFEVVLALKWSNKFDGVGQHYLTARFRAHFPPKHARDLIAAFQLMECFCYFRCCCRGSTTASRSNFDCRS